MSNDDLKVLSIALRTAERGPMREVDEATAATDEGLIGDVPKKEVERGVTFLSRSQWDQVNQELDADLPWHTRRANILLDAPGSLASLIGRRIRVGNEVEVQVVAETRPCGLMDHFHNGLQKRLDPDCRAGVYGRVLQAGPIRVGDTVQVISS